MRRDYTRLFLHAVWATWDRLALIEPAWEPRLYGALRSKCTELGCELLAVGSVANHVHVAVRFPPVLSISDLMHDLKGSTSHLVSHEINPGHFFKWMGRYGAFSLRKSDVPDVCDYIERQKIHHAERRLWTEFERFEEIVDEASCGAAL